MPWTIQIIAQTADAFNVDISRALYEAVLRAFISDPVLEQAQKALASGDKAALLSVAHEARGSSGNAGINRLYKAASDLVALLRRESYTGAELADSFRQFEREYQRAYSGIELALR